jgi:hypothetical protein
VKAGGAPIKLAKDRLIRSVALGEHRHHLVGGVAGGQKDRRDGAGRRAEQPAKAVPLPRKHLIRADQRHAFGAATLED